VTARTARGPRRPPVERVRDELAAAAGPWLAAQLPSGYQRLGHVLVVRWPESLRAHFPVLSEAFRRALGVRTILRHSGPVAGEERTPTFETLLDGPTETEVVEGGVRWRLDAARLLFSSGNRSERARAGRLVLPGETVVDLFAGIGYFALPAAKVGRAARVLAVDRNPLAVRYLEENIRRNGVGDRVEPVLGDNREVPLPGSQADRVFLGYLPSAVPWVARAVPLVRPDGGWLHVHTVADAGEGWRGVEDEVAAAIARVPGARADSVRAREVKPYGPGRTHLVVDARVTPSAG
jgi:tRNA wybutosine-synthesizing protein 2